MKKLNSLLLLIGLVTPLVCLGEDVCRDQYGTLRCGKGKIDNIHYRGTVEMDGSTVEGEVSVNGTVNVENAHLNQVKITGVAHLQTSDIAGEMQHVGNVFGKKLEIHDKTKVIGNFFGSNVSFHSSLQNVGVMECDLCHFHNEVTLVGEIKANHSSFLSPISINARNSQFSHSKLNDIFVQKPSHDEEQVVHLSNGTTAHNIMFESQKGLVILHDNAKITGKVQGAKVAIRCTHFTAPKANPHIEAQIFAIHAA